MKGKSLMARFLSVILALMMVISVSPVAYAAEAIGDAIENTSSAEELTLEKAEGVNADVRLEETKVDSAELKGEPEYADTDVVRVSIFLEDKATLDKYSTTNVAENNSAMAYREKLQEKQANITAMIERHVLGGRSLDVVWNLTLAANAISANVQYGYIDEIEEVKGVEKVVIEEQYAPMVVSTEGADPLMSTSSQMIGSGTAWASGYTGAGTRIAIIDTGIDTDHQSFSSEAFMQSLAQNAEAKGVDINTYLSGLKLLDSAEISSVLTKLNIYPFVQYLGGTANGDYYINEKIPFAINYVDRDYDVTHDNDYTSEHGSHVAGIAAANSLIPNGNGGYDNALETVHTQGVAPDAQIIVMKVFGKNGGAYDADYMVAIEDAILLGCDVVNLSLGADKGFARSKEYQEILNNLATSNTIVAIAAGNSGSFADNSANGVPYLYAEDVDFSMVANPAAATNSLAVASVDNIGATNYYINAGGSIIFYEHGTSTSVPMDNLTTLAGDVNYIFTETIATAEDVAAIVAKEGTIAPNTILVCSRGQINFAVKASNAIENGFVGTIVYNNEEGVIYMNMEGYEYSNPCVSVTLADSIKLKENAAAVTDENGNPLYYKGTMYISDTVTSSAVSDNYTMSSFSSWGVPGSLELKPEITAPGGNIYSVNGADPSGTAYENMSGTSMASPQIAGMAALVMQYVKEKDLDDKTGLTARQLATALLMGTAEPVMNNGSYASVLQQGAGLANVGNAINASSYIKMSESATSGASDGKVKVELGDDPSRTGSYSFSFTINSISDETMLYSLSGDFFTQSVLGYAGIAFADTATTAIGVGVDYTIDGDYISASSEFDCDLNNDDVTDEKDAQIILEYAAGNLESIADKADLSEDGSVTTYDAHLLLASIGSGYFMVAPGESINVTVSLTLSEETKAFLDTNFENGAYVEGFVFVEPLVTEEGAMESDYSIPVLGFYGNWSDASMYDHLNYEEYLYYVNNGGEVTLPYSGGLNYLTFFDGNDERYYVGNPYVIEDTFPTEKVAISPNTELGDMATSLIRNAGGFMVYVADENGEILVADSADQIHSAFYYINGGYWAYTNSAGLSFWQTPSTLAGLGDGDKFTVGFMAVPEYYEKDGALSTEDMLELMESGTIGEGAYHSYSFTIDGTYPEILSVKKGEDGNLTVTAKDNQYVAAIAVLSASGGTVYSVNAVEQDTPNTEVTAVINMEGLTINRNCLVMVADYAGNETYYQVQYNDGVSDFDGKMYAFTNVSTRGVADVWMEVDPATLSYVSDDENNVSVGGTVDLSVMDCSVTAAEYVNGYVFMITDNNELVVAAQGEWEFNLLGGASKSYANIKDLAYNTSDGKLYALGKDNTIYTVDIITGELEKQYTVSLTFPKTVAAENNELLTLAIDDEGNFYSVNNGDSNYKRVYLFSWSAEDVEGGKVTDLAPVNNDSEGFLGYYIYNDSIGTNGVPTTQSMAWDHDNDILYYAAALANVSPYNILYTIDTATGKAAQTGTEATGVQDYQRGMFNGNVSGLYIVPTEKGTIGESEEATSVILYDATLTLLEGAEYQLDWDVLPWNLSDMSVTWETSNADVAAISESGVITAVSEGTATITLTTAAAPNLTATCEVTVEPIKDLSLNAMVYNEDSAVEWISFDLLDAENWTGNYTENSHYFIAGGQLDDVVYVHDGNRMYGVNTDTFEVSDYGYLDATWQWSDAAPGPKTEDGYFGRLVGIISGGLSIGVMDVENGLGYDIPNYNFRSDPLAAIAYIGPAKYTDSYGTYNAQEYYVLSESGALYKAVLWAFYDTDAMTVYYDDVITYVGETGLRLYGASNVNDSRKASMYYDAESNYLVVASYQGGDYASLYVLQPETCAPVEVGNFGADVWPVTTLYKYDTITELTVKVDPSEAEVYAGETVELTAKVYPENYSDDVTWSSSDETVATVDENGVVTTLSAGTVVITATSVETNENGEHASAEVTITVNALFGIEETFHAYIETEEGGKWVAIDGSDLSYVVTGESDASYTGAAVSEGKVYATDDTYYYEIDPANGYAVTQGDNFTDGDGEPFMYMLDGSSAPLTVRDFVDLSTGETVEGVEVGGYPVYISGYDGNGYHYLTTLNDYETGKFAAAEIAYNYYPAAIAYHYSEEIEDYWFDFYYILGYDGLVEHYSLYTGIADGESYVAGGWESDAIDTGLEFEDGDDVSMVYVSNDSFTGLVISHATEEGVDLYSFALESGELNKMGRIKGATDLVGLSLIGDVNVEVPEEPVEPEEGDKLHGYIQTEEGGAWVSIDITNASYEALSDYGSADYTGAGVSKGKIYASDKNNYYEIDPENGYASTVGATVKYDYPIMDGAGVPEQTIFIIDQATGNLTEATVGGYMPYVGGESFASYMMKLYDYTNNSTVKAKYMGAYTSMVRAITFLYSEVSDDSMTYSEYFLVLTEGGNVYKARTAWTLEDGKFYSQDTAESLGTISVDPSSGASMAAVSEDKVYISVNADDGVVIYSYEISTSALTEVYTIEDAVSLAGLSVLSDVVPEEEEPIEPDEPIVPDEPEEGDMLHGYIQTEEGGVWVSINASDLSYEALSNYGTEEYTGAAVSEGQIYVTDVDVQNYYKIDPTQGYASTKGAYPKWGYAIQDGTGVPVQTIELFDAYYEEYVEVQVGGPKYAVGDPEYGENYIFALNDYTSSNGAKYIMLDIWDNLIVSIEFISSEIDEFAETYYENYVILCENGDLYECRIAYFVEADYMMNMCTLNKVGNIGVTAYSGASMTAYTEDMLYISTNADDGVKFYSYERSTATLTSIGTIEEAVTLVGLGPLSEVSPAAPEEPEEPVDPEDPEDPEEPSEPGDGYLYGYASTGDGYVWVKLNASDLSYEAVSEAGSTQYYAAGYSNEKVYAVTGVYKYGNTDYYYQQIDPANGYAAEQGTTAPGSGFGGYSPIDFTGTPETEVELVDSVTGETVNVTVGGLVLHASNGRYSSSVPKVYIVTDWKGTEEEYYVEPYVSSSTFTGKLAAIAYVGSEISEDGKSYYENFLIVAQDGKLYDYQLTTTVSNGVASVYGAANVSSDASIDLTATSGASMTAVSEDVVYISVNTTDGVAVYSYEISTATLTEVGTVADFNSLVGLYVTAFFPEEEPEETVDNRLHGYVKTANGYEWVIINEDMSLETVASGSENYNAAGYSSGKMYAVTGVSKYGNTTYTYQQIDPANGYTATAGSIAASNYHPVDFSGAPEATVELVDSNTGSSVNALVGGYAVHVSNGQWSSSAPKVYAVTDWSTGYSEIYTSSSTFSGKLAAIAYLNSEISEDGKSYYDNFLILAQDGNLYNCQIVSNVKNGSVSINGAANVSSAGSVELTATSGASMTAVSEDMVYISVNSAEGVVIYSYEISTATLTEVGTVSGATSLVGLSLAREVAAETAEAENRVMGSLMSVVVSGEAVNTGDVVSEGAVIGDGKVTINLSETEAVTNGEIVVTFDPSALTYSGVTSGSVKYAVNDSEAAEGKLVIAYAAASEVPAGNILATVSFTYAGETVDTEVSIDTVERNDSATVNDETTVVSVTNASDDNTLKSIVTENGTLEPEFDPEVTDYTVEVDHDEDQLELVAEANDPNATVVVDNPVIGEDGTATVTITVTAENGDVRTYTIKVTRKEAPSGGNTGNSGSTVIIGGNDSEDSEEQNPGTGGDIEQAWIIALVMSAAGIVFFAFERKKKMSE